MSIDESHADAETLAWVPPEDGTCDAWPVIWPCDISTSADELVQAAYDAAWQLLWALSGRQFGVCTYTEGYWPRCTCICCVPPDVGMAVLINNRGTDGLCCALTLGHQPVRDITKVVIENCLVDPSLYFVRGTQLIYRDGCWPCGSLCDYPPIVIEYRAGQDFPAGTAAAVGEVACEFLRAFNGEPCKLPSRATSITRQGVTITLADPGYFLTLGRIGLAIADAWLAMVNPKAIPEAPLVWSPDLPRTTAAKLVQLP